MVTIGSSSLTSAPAEPDTPEAPAKDAKKRVPLAAIPVTLSVGLLLAVGYVGARIISARSQGAAVVAVATATVPAASVVAAATAPPPSPSAVAAATTPQVLSEPAKTNPMEAPSHEIVDAGSPVLSAVRAAVAPENSPENSDEGLIAPQHGERYLQIAAISASVAQKYLAGLGRYNIQANVAPGPHDGLVRIVIGPFPDRESVAAVKAQIQAMWPDCFVRLY